MPMISGAQPATATALIRARIASPWRRAKSSLQTSSAALPSVSGDEVAAVTLPPNAGFNWARLSRLVPGRMQPSSATRPAGVSMATISSRSKPASRAATALAWERTAISSCSTRLTA